MTNQDKKQISNEVKIRGLVVRVFEKRYEDAPEAYLVSFYTKYPFVKGGEVTETFTRNAFLVKTTQQPPESGDVVDLKAVLNIYNDRAYLYELERTFLKKSENFNKNNKRQKQASPPEQDEEVDFGPEEIPF